jgi:hypothetical protein
MPENADAIFSSLRFPSGTIDSPEGEAAPGKHSLTHLFVHILRKHWLSGFFMNLLSGCRSLGMPPGASENIRTFHEFLHLLFHVHTFLSPSFSITHGNNRTSIFVE